MVINGVRAISNFKPTPKSPAGEGLALAETCIKSKSGKSGGTTPAEVEAAELMAQMSAMYRDLTISKESGKTKGVFRKAAKGMDAKDFVAYCKVKGDGVLFLLHVPDLRKFEEAAKKTMLEGAWMSAQFAVAAMPEPKPRRLMVGIRGILSYYGAHTGKVMDSAAIEALEDSNPTKSQMGIDSTTTDADGMETDFLTYFETPAPAAPVAPPELKAP